MLPRPGPRWDRSWRATQIRVAGNPFAASEGLQVGEAADRRGETELSEVLVEQEGVFLAPATATGCGHAGETTPRERVGDHGCSRSLEQA